MRRHLIPAVAVLFALASSAAFAQPAADPDYRQDSAWLCRPGEETNCTTGLDAMRVTPDGQRTPEAFVPATDPPIDCFFVYPTVSMQTSTYSDMTAGPEVIETLKGQAARLTSRCRLFAPIYRQLTMTGLKQVFAGGAQPNWDGPYRDVLAAWRDYLARDNHGRGVVLIGHSQGAILLQRLIAEQIDGKPMQKRLVSAFLGGDPEISVAAGGRTGGSFKHIPTCATAGETGCVYAWTTYLSDDANHRMFGRDPGHGLTTACVNPAAPGGGSGELDAYLPRPKAAPTDDPPWVHAVGQLSAECVRDTGGDVLSVTIQPTRYAALLQAGLPRFVLAPGWGLHRLDLSLPQGNVLDLVAAQSTSWVKR
ncbi:DUF3089 domain-containing protein [Caulobacter sp. S45]|jgi:hypothetical protein|uniref:DUF3089 domain-containing protein n=1 Tax=Caulobacter sp. S45 TaxID=1641861 RepID=UPI00131CAA59|nr:DUF3089 domain-containing protein [Caulobacter sp. S45]